MKIAKFHPGNGMIAPAAKIVPFSWKSVLIALVKYQGLHEGIWRVRLSGNSATYIQMNPAGTRGLVPAMVVPVGDLELVLDSEVTPLSVDAAVVNPELPRSSPIILPNGALM